MIARFINRHFIPIASLLLAAILALGLLLAFSGCYLEDRESMRPVYGPSDVMQDVQDQADRHPLEGWSP